MRNNCLIVFVRYPEPGQVKSRLARDCGNLFAADLYRAFILDTLAYAGKGDWHLRVFYDPPEKEDSIKEMLGRGRSYRPQRGKDLGARMANAFQDCFAEGSSSVVLIGSDVPDLPDLIVQSAFDLLAGPGDAVVGPAADGGYYLIGFKAEAFTSDIFADIPWGTNCVCRDTLKILREHDCRVSLLAEWQDVDTRDDLIRLAQRSRQTPFACSRTMQYLKSSGKFPMS